MTATFAHLIADLPLSAAIALKTSLVLCSGLVVVRMLRQRSAAARHFVLATSLTGTLLLVIGSPFAPTVPLRIAVPVAPEPAPLSELRAEPQPAIVTDDAALV